MQLCANLPLTTGLRRVFRHPLQHPWQQHGPIMRYHRLRVAMKVERWNTHEHTGASWSLLSVSIYLSFFQVDATVMTSCLPIQSSWQSSFTSTTHDNPVIASTFMRGALPSTGPSTNQGLHRWGRGRARPNHRDNMRWDSHRWPLRNTHQQSTTW